MEDDRMIDDGMTDAETDGMRNAGRGAPADRIPLLGPRIPDPDTAYNATRCRPLCR